jgi:hypothetical protein
MGPREAAIYRHEQRKARDPRADIKAAAKLLDQVPESVRAAARARGETLSVSWVNGKPQVGTRRAGVTVPLVGTAVATRTLEQFRARMKVRAAAARGSAPGRAARAKVAAAREKVAAAKRVYAGTGG